MTIASSLLRTGAVAGALFAVAATASAQWDLTILHNNDGESQLLGFGPDNDFGGIARFVTAVNETRAFYEAMDHAVVTVSSGDNFIPSKEFFVSQQDGVYYDAIGISNIGYDAVVLGNHDFDFGPNVLADFIGAVSPSIPYLSSNLDFSPEPALNALTGSRLFPSTMVTKNTISGPKKIGIVGATTENLSFITSPGNVGINPVLGAVQNEINSLKGAGADAVILISHLQGINEEIDLIPSLSGVDVVVAGGGSELLANPATPLLPGDSISGPYPVVSTGPDGELQPVGPTFSEIQNADGKVVPVVTTTGEYGYLGALQIQFDALGNASFGGEPIRILNGEFAEDAATKAAVSDPVAAGVAALESNIIGQALTKLEGTSDSVRSKETNTGNLVADAQFTAAKERAAEFGAPRPDFAAVNGGGIRNSDIEAGDISEGTTFDISPFGNFVSIVEGFTGEDLEIFFENAVSRLVLTPGGEVIRQGDGTGRFAQVSANVDLIVDPSKDPLVLDGDGNIVEMGERIIALIVNGEYIIKDGEVVSGDETFNVVMPDFSARGGDQYNLAGLDFTTLGITDQRALFQYIVEDEGGDINDRSYDYGVNERIKYIPEPSSLALVSLGALAIVLLRRNRR